MNRLSSDPGYGLGVSISAGGQHKVRTTQVRTNITFLFSPIRLLIAGAWPQNCKILLQRNVARVKIATGPAFVLG